MKRLLFSVVFTIITLSIGFSQITLLMEGGINSGKTTLLKTEELTTESILKYYMSATPKFKISKRLTAQGEFQYSLEGYESDGILGHLEHNLHYIRFIPGLAVHIIGPLNLIGGLNLGYLALADGGEDRRSFVFSREFYRETDIGILAGLNIEIAKINLVIKYNFGLVSISDDAATVQYFTEPLKIHAKNRFLQVGLGYRFDFNI